MKIVRDMDFVESINLEADLEMIGDCCEFQQKFEFIVSGVIAISN